jgi:hypothetical protein
LPDVLQQVVDTVNYTFDMRKKISTNMETLRAKANRIVAYGINHDESFLALTLMSNVTVAAQHEWGHEFRPAIQTIRMQYPYNHTHNATSLNKIMQELAAVDAVRSLKESVSLLQQLMQSSQEYQESAMAATSDSESSGDRKTRSSNRSGRGRSKSRKSRGSGRGEKNTCTHYKKYRRKKAHPNIPEEKCFWNKAYKGYCKD